MQYVDVPTDGSCGVTAVSVDMGIVQLLPSGWPNPQTQHVGLIEPTPYSRGHAIALQQRRHEALYGVCFIQGSTDFDDHI
jgi:hypothetical protein